MPNTTIDTLEVKITSNALNAAKALDSLAKSLNGVRSALKGTKRDGGPIAEKLAKSIHELNNAMTRINSDGVRKLQSMSNALNSYGKGLQRLGGASGAARRVGDITSALGGDGSAVDNTAVPFANYKETVERYKDSMSSLADITDKLNDKFNNLGKSVKKARRDINKADKTVNKANKSLSKLVKSIGRIAMYRAIRSAMKSITEAFSEGLKNAYLFSAQSENFQDLANTLDHLKSVTSQMVNQLGAFAGELVQFVAPALEWVIEKVRYLAEKATELFAALNGKDDYQFAVYQQKRWDDAADSLKKYKQQLLGLDEINNLTKDEDKDKETATDVSKSYELKQVSSTMKTVAAGINDVLNVLKGAFQSIHDTVLAPLGMVAIGALLIFTNHPLVGLGLVLSGAAWTYENVVMNWDSLRKSVKKAFKKYKKLFAIGAVGAVAVGALLLFTHNYVAGIACILAGTGVGTATLAFNWDDLLNHVRTAFENVLNWLKDTFIPKFDKVKEYIQNPLGEGIDLGEPSKETVPAYQRVKLPSNTLQKIADVVVGVGAAVGLGFAGGGSKGFNTKNLDYGFASGGIPERGTLFYAGESGPEFVSSIGSSSAVANTGQMTEAIYKAAYMGMSQALKENGGMNGFEPATTDDLFIAMRKKASKYNKRTGNSAFA